MKKIINLALTFAILLSLSSNAFSQKSYGDLYNPEANAAQELDQLIEIAKETKQHIIVQVGGNWCVWCYRFHDFVKENPDIQAIVDEHYLVYDLNYSQENTNDEILAKFKFPQRFGFPVMLILDSEGKLIHTQNSALLEAGKGYDAKKVKEFFLGWTKKALDPTSYEK